MEEFTFSVSDVLDYLGVQHARSGSRDTEDVVCPICKGKKLHVVYSKNLARISISAVTALCLAKSELISSSDFAIFRDGVLSSDSFS